MKLKNVYLCLFVYLSLKTIMGASTKSSTKYKYMKLELVQTLFRHGERTVDEIEFHAYHYTNADVYKPWGFGQLTNNGKKQEYKIGKMLRRRYANFLNENYNTSDVYAYSSEDDRTKMSLQLVLAGLYPPTPQFTWNEDLNWMPLPARYTPKKLDILLKPSSSSKFQALMMEAQNTKEYRKKMSEYTDFFSLIKEKTGISIKTNSSKEIGLIFNTLFVNERLNIWLPDWYTPKTKKTLFDITEYALKTMSSTTEMQRINGGTMIRTFLGNMNVNNTVINPRKIYLYSGHDLNLSAVTMSWGIGDTFKIPDFGTGVIVEKWRDCKDRLYVRLLAWTEPGGEPKTLKLKNCEKFCPIDDYVKIISDVLPFDEEMNYLTDDFNMANINDLFFGDPAVQP